MDDESERINHHTTIPFENQNLSTTDNLHTAVVPHIFHCWTRRHGSQSPELRAYSSSSSHHLVCTASQPSFHKPCGSPTFAEMRCLRGSARINPGCYSTTMYHTSWIFRDGCVIVMVYMVAVRYSYLPNPRLCFQGGGLAAPIRRGRVG